MQKIIALLIFSLCSGAFTKSIHIEIWDIGNGSSAPVIKNVKEKGNELKQNGTIINTHIYSPNFPVCGGAHKVCHDVAEGADFDMALKEFTIITLQAKAVDSCPESDDTWTRH